MGYQTRHELKWSSRKPFQPIPTCEDEVPAGAKFCPECGERVFVTLDDAVGNYIEKNDDLNYPLSASGRPEEPCTWYEHEKDMRAMSEKFADVLFTLRGEGEEGGDIWVKYFLNGKMQVAQAKFVIDDFDESKLV